MQIRNGKTSRVNEETTIESLAATVNNLAEEIEIIKQRLRYFESIEIINLDAGGEND